MKIKVSELTGAALDYAVAIATGVPVICNPYDKGLKVDTGYWAKVSGSGYQAVGGGYSPSTNWEQVGVLLEKFKPDLMTYKNGFIAWLYSNEDDERNPVDGYGETYPIAACRVITASQLGDEIEVPDALVVNNEQP